MVKYIAFDLVKRLKSLNYVEVNVVGDHHIFKNMENGKRVSIPYSRRKDTVAVGTARQILKIVESESNNQHN